MSKLHEILAVEGDLEGVAKKIVKEATETFTKRTEHFRAGTRVLKMFDENRKQENTTEQAPMATTVHKKLGYVAHQVAKFYDVMAAKDFTNTNAKADFVVDGTVMLKDAPATFLLGLENRLKQMRQMYECIPTLNPAQEWELDPTKGDGVYKDVHGDIRQKTEKQVMSKIVAEATTQHKAQVETWNADIPVGEVKVEAWSSALTPHEKSNILERLDNLIQAAKKARQRANCALVEKVEIGEAIFTYLHK